LAAAAVLLPIWCIDCLMNAMVFPIFIVLVGGLAGAVEAGLPPLPPSPRKRIPDTQRLRAGPQRATVDVLDLQPSPEDAAPTAATAEEECPTAEPPAENTDAPAPPPGVLVRRLPGQR